MDEPIVDTKFEPDHIGRWYIVDPRPDMSYNNKMVELEYGPNNNLYFKSGSRYYFTNDLSVQHCLWIDMEPFYRLVDEAVKIYNYNQKGDTQP